MGRRGSQSFHRSGGVWHFSACGRPNQPSADLVLFRRRADETPLRAFSEDIDFSSIRIQDGLTDHVGIVEEAKPGVEGVIPLRLTQDPTSHRSEEVVSPPPAHYIGCVLRPEWSTNLPERIFGATR